jgi:hypothetical protein
VGEDAQLRRLLDEVRIPCVEQDDHWAGRFAHDLVDQFERML